MQTPGKFTYKLSTELQTRNGLIRPSACPCPGNNLQLIFIVLYLHHLKSAHDQGDQKQTSSVLSI